MKTVDILTHVNKQSHPGALAIEVDCRLKFLIKEPSHNQAKQQADALIQIAELPTAGMHAADTKSVFTAQFSVGLMLVGMFRTQLAGTIDLAQARKAGTLYTDACEAKYGKHILQQMPAGTGGCSLACRVLNTL